MPTSSQLIGKSAFGNASSFFRIDGIVDLTEYFDLTMNPQQVVGDSLRAYGKAILPFIKKYAPAHPFGRVRGTSLVDELKTRVLGNLRLELYGPWWMEPTMEGRGPIFPVSKSVLRFVAHDGTVVFTPYARAATRGTYDILDRTESGYSIVGQGNTAPEYTSLQGLTGETRMTWLSRAFDDLTASGSFDDLMVTTARNIENRMLRKSGLITTSAFRI